MKCHKDFKRCSVSFCGSLPKEMLFLWFFLNTPRIQFTILPPQEFYWAVGAVFRSAEQIWFLTVFMYMEHIPWNWKNTCFSCGPFPSYDCLYLLVTFPVLCNIWFLCQHVPCLNRKKHEAAGPSWVYCEACWNERCTSQCPTIARPGCLSLRRKRTKTNTDSQVLKLIMKPMNTHVLCFGDTCSVNKHQISTSMSWSIYIQKSSR